MVECVPSIGETLGSFPSIPQLDGQWDYTHL